MEILTRRVVNLIPLRGNDKGRAVTLCEDGSMWITDSFGPRGRNVRWVKIDEPPENLDSEHII